MLCTFCNVENPEYAMFCTNCGRRLEKEIHTPSAGIGQAPAEQVAVMQESFPAGRDSPAHATLPSSPPALPLASTFSPDKYSSVAVLDRVYSPGQQSSKGVSNTPAPAVPFQQAQPWERFGSPSDQQASFSDKTLPAMPTTQTSAPRHNVATLPPPTNGNSPPISVGSPPTSSPPKKGLRDRLPKKWRIMALIALIILLVGGSASLLIPWLHTTLPATTATVTITPASQHLTKTYAINAVTGTPDTSQHQVQARLLSFTTQAQSKTVKATGKGHQDATQAKGKVTLSPSSGTVPAGNYRIPSNSGVNVIVYVTNSISSGSQTFDAWAENNGSGGNIPAYDIDGSYHLVADPNVNLYIQNTQAFTGGQDAHDYTFVQQSDIDGVATPLVNKLTSDAQAAVQKQLRANEQFTGTPESTPNIKTNHKAGDQVTDVTVTVTVTSKGEVYNQQAAQSTAENWLRTDAASQPGDHYALIGDTVIGAPVVVTTDTNGIVSLNVSAEGVWVYQFSDAQKQAIAQLIAGKSLADTQALLQKQTNIQKFVVTTADGWGTALPTAPSDIKFIVLPMPGLQATPTS